MPLLVTVALYNRGKFSLGNSRRVFGYEAYHWSLIVSPEVSRGDDCYTFDATDISEIDPATFRMTNPTMDWWFRAKENVDPALSGKLLGRIVIGQVPDGVSSAKVRDVLAGVRLPVKNTDPQQSGVTWAVDAIRTLQREGWVKEFDIDHFKDWVLAYADERMKGADSKEGSVGYYRVQN